jgi:uncharacterized protein (DUF2141 family)
MMSNFQKLNCDNSAPRRAFRLRTLSLMIAAVVFTSPVFPPGLLGQVFAPQPRDARARYILSGTVTNSVTGAPVYRALVQVFAGSAHSNLTDSEGHFRFENLPESETQVSVRKPGFFSEQELNEGQPSLNVVHIGPDSPMIALKLTPEGIIFGRLTSEGEPVEGVPVKLIAPRIREGRKRWEQAGYASTDEEGAFRVSNLRPGSYYVAVGPSSGMSPRAVNAKARGYAQVFYPGVPDIASAAPFELTAGQQIEADFSLKRDRVFRVSGTISAPAQVKGVNLQFINSAGDAGSFGYRFDPVSGSFSSTVTAGAYTLRAQAFENGQVGIAELPLTINSDVTGVSLALAPPTSIPVLVNAELSSAQARQVTDSGTVPINSHLVSSGYQLTSADYWATLRRAGKQQSLSFENIQPGKYSLEVSPNGSFYVQSARCGDTDLLRDDLIVTADLRLPPLEIVVRDDGANLNVSLQDSQAKGTVLLIPDQLPRQVKTGFASGQLQFSGLAPGEYSVIALDNAEGLEYTNPEVLSPYMGSAAHVTLGPKQNSTVTLQVTRVGK